MRKKILLTTLAFSMAFSTMAALPFASEGISGNLGFVQKAEASAASEVLTQVKQRIDAIYTQVSTEDQKKVDAAIELINKDSGKTSAISKIQEKLTHLSKAELSEDVYKLVKSAALIALGETSEIDNFRRNGDHYKTLKAIDPTITYADVEQFGNLMFTELTNEERITTLVGAINGSLKDAVKTYVEGSIAAVLGNQTNAVVGVLNKAQVSASDLTAIYNTVSSSDAAVYKDALKAVTAAAVKVELKAVDSYAIDYRGAYLALEMKHNDEYSQKLSGILLQNAGGINGKLDWTIESSTLTVDDNGKLTVKNNPASGTYQGTVTATVTIGGEQFVIVDGQSISVQYTTTSSSSSTIVGSTVSTTPAGLPDYTTLNQAMNTKLEELRAELAAALTSTAKADVLAKMQQLFNEYMLAAGTINVYGYVTDKEDVAILNLTQDHLREMMKEVDKQFKAAIELFSRASTELKVPRLTISLNMGNTKSNAFDIKLNKGLMEQMTSYSIEQTRVLSKGFITKMTVANMQSDIAWTIKSAGTKAARSAAAMTLSNVPVIASDIYDVEFTAPTTWKAGSVFVNVPINADFKLPKHSLQVASIVNNAATNLTPNNGDYEYELTQAHTSVAITGRDVQFNDIDRVETWAGAQIDFAASLGIIDGTGNGQFAPNEDITRAQLAKMMVQAFELANADKASLINDIPSTAWYSNFVKTVVEAGLMNVYTDGNFEPNKSMSRAEVTAVAARAMQKLYGWEAVTNVDEVLSVFKDADQIHPSLREDVALAVKHNLVIGYNGCFNAKDDISRAQVAVIIYRLLNN